MTLDRVLPFLLPSAGLFVVWLLRPGVVENAARSPLAWAIAAGGVAAAVGVRAAATRFGASALVARSLSTALVLALLAVVLAPSFRQRTLVEDLPADLLAGPTASAVPSAEPAPSVSSTPTTTPATPRAVVSSPAAPQPVAVNRSGALRGIGHTAGGTVHLRSSGGAAFVVFDDVDIEGSVEPSVHLVPEGRTTPSGGIRLGALKAEKGTFSYRLPASVDPTVRWSVLIWCDPFNTPIAAADPR